MTTNERELLNTILQSMQETYHSLEEPDFRFAVAALESGRWADVIAQLRADVEVEEVTDLNDDVSRVLLLRDNGHEFGMLQLSFVGPYGVLFLYGAAPREVACITGEEGALNERARSVVHICERAGVKLLSKPLLSTNVPLRLLDTDPESVRVYQALFTDRGYIPGDYDGQFG